MDPLRQDPDRHHVAHLEDALRTLSLPLEVNGLHWHPFGVYTIPLARRVDDGGTWSRRLHLWHPEGIPVGEASLYGVHTHSGTACSHVLVGSLYHHLYGFEADPEGAWRERSRDGQHMARLTAHVRGETRAGVTHTLPPHQAHGVSKPDGWAISLFEQREEGRQAPFTTWQRTDVREEPLLGTGPVPRSAVQSEARALVEQALALVQV